uniref:Helicase n=1 Tax=Mudumu virus TaxID=2841875 RepID=A0A8E8V1P7_9REOV|nr:helicase [Mudumu virus]
MRIILLAPGDVIEESSSEIKERGIDIKIKLQKEKQQEENGTGSGGRASETEQLSRDDRRNTSAGDSGTKDKDGGIKIPTDHNLQAHPETEGPRTAETGGGNRKGQNESSQGEGETGLGNDGKEGRCAAERTEPGSGGSSKHATEQDAEKNQTTKGNKGDIKQDSSVKKGDAACVLEKGKDTSHRKYVLSAGIRHGLGLNFDVDVATLEPNTMLRDKDVIYQFSQSVIRHLNLEPDCYREQADTLQSFKNSATDVDKKKNMQKNIMKIESVAMLKKTFPERKIASTSSSSSVVLVTNLKVYVPRAHVLFNAPTGDVTWKDVSREATQRSSIRAYTFKYDKDNTPAKALIALIDSL